jgi:molybdopterin molybdotransferase
MLPRTAPAANADYNARVISVEEALSAIDRETAALGSEPLPVAEAGGRVLARPVLSDVDWPPFDTSAMDGYAILLADAGTPGARVAERSGTVAAGDAPPPPLSPGEAVRVMTGAPVPPGTQAVVPVEQAERRDGQVVLAAAPRPGAHLRRRGESVAAGVELLPAGRRLSATDVALAALAGADPVAVYRRPRVAIAATGNELVPASQRPGPGQLRDSNSPMLASLCRERGISPRILPRARDETRGLAALFGMDVAQSADVILTSGGVSAGDFDLVPAEAARHGFSLVFHGVAIRPGKPLAFGRRGNVFWFGLPGNPVSASVGFRLFVRRAFDRLEGVEQPGPSRFFAALSSEVRPGKRETWKDALFTAGADGARVAPVSSAGSHDIAAHSRANALVRIPPGDRNLPAGSPVECILLETA